MRIDELCLKVFNPLHQLRVLRTAGLRILLGVRLRGEQCSCYGRMLVLLLWRRHS